MNITDFIKFVELYYGEYKNEWIKESLIHYLKKEWIYESEIERLYKSLIRFYSSSYSKNGAPDIAIIEKVDREFRIRQWSAGGDRIIPPGEKKSQLEILEDEPEDREDFCKQQRELFEKAKQKIEKRMERVKKQNQGGKNDK